MTCAISKPHFILLFICVIFIVHTLAEPPEVVKNEFMAWRKRSHEARLSSRTNRSLQFSNITGFHSNVNGFQKPQDSPNDEASGNWAGAIQNSPPSGTYCTVSAVWNVPDITLPSGASGVGVWGAAVWVGTAPSSCPNTLLQADTWTYLAVDDNGNISKEVAAWYEWYPAPLVFVAQTEYPVAIGDPISVYVGASSPSQAIAAFINTATDYTATLQVSAPNSSGDNICGASTCFRLKHYWELRWSTHGGFFLSNCGRV